MVSKNDLLVGVLVLIGGLIIYSFAPGGALFAAPSPGPPPDPTPHSNTHYIGGALAIIFGLVGFALMKKTSKLTWAVAVLSIILGLVFILDAPGQALYAAWQPHGTAMQTTGALTALVGLVGVIGAVVWKKK
jgi:hypothetical protein